MYRYAAKRSLAVCFALFVILGVVVRFNVDSDVNGVSDILSLRSTVDRQGKKIKKLVNSNCVYSVSAFDRTGQRQSEPLSNSCLESNADLLTHLVSQSSAVVDDPNATAVIAISVVDRQKIQMIESLALVADEFLTPRMDWRIMAERFLVVKKGGSDSDESGNTTGSDVMEAKPTVEQSRLLLDPAAYAPTEIGTFADPFISAIRALRNDESGGMLRENRNAASAGKQNSNLMDESIHVDLILVRVLEEKVAAFANALRRFQFPKSTSDDKGEDSECAKSLAINHGRTWVKYGGPTDFLGAWTTTSARSLSESIAKGFPFIRVSPVQWARTYHFDTCSAETVAAIDPELGIVNGLDCGFLPIYGGTCLRDRVDPSLKCMSEFKMGSLSHVVLPKNGIPEEVCQSSHEEAPPYTATTLHGSFAKPFFEWCPSCMAFGYKGNRTITPKLLSDPSAPMGFGELNKADMATINKNVPTCGMELNDLSCGDDGRPCCWSEVKISQDVLGSHNGTAEKMSRAFHPSIFNMYLVRFNRSSRNRIARLYHPRLSAMIARGVGWESALATGKCATLHIRRGDNMNRCENGEKHFCSMNLTLADYMEKASPMLDQLGDAKHVFVMTDDPAIADKKRQEPFLKDGYFIEVISGHNQYSEETFSDWDPFIESLHAAQFCRAFVGHHISTVSSLVFKSICMRWGECPLTDDFRARSSGYAW